MTIRLIMTCLATLCLTANTFAVDAAKADPLVAEQQQLVDAAQAHIDAWRAAGEGDVRGERPLVITLFTGNDTPPAPKYRERLTRTMKHIQAFYAKEMDRNGFGELTFKLPLADDGLLDIHVVQGDKPNDAYSGKSGQAIRKMVLEHLKTKEINGHQETVVIFCNLTKWDPKARKMSHHSPYYAGGSHQAGTAWQLDSALLDSATLDDTDKQRHLHDGQYGHISLGRYQSIFIGGICHELGHALGLPHNKQRADERERWGTALMGSGNRTYGEELRDEGKGSFLTLAHAMKLAVHPAFSGSVKQMRKGPKRTVHDLNIEITQEGKAISITGRIESDIPVHAVLAYIDPEGGSDYNATTHVAVPDKDGTFKLDCNSFVKAKGDIRLVYVHANGWAAFSKNVSWPYTRTKDGQLAIGQQANATLNGQGLEVLATMPVLDGERLCPCCAEQ